MNPDNYLNSRIVITGIGLTAPNGNNLADFRRSYGETYKRQVGREVALDAGASSGRDAGGPAAPLPSPSSLAAAREQNEELWRALDRLPEEYRRVLLLRHQEERSFEEIGAAMNRSANAARKLWARALERLQQEWESLT